ncbi:endoglucanase 8-like [Salvia hispanica]|uniref:endoglucanase 8-like n=1 Tax=Salvia hispanica TaxID=49212 RepID=UPI002009D347|nr:endoglucanase 8-like [Salvia hispanica]
MYVSSGNAKSHDYGDALSKSLLFFEGQRSGKLPSTQRVRWRKDSALRDGFDKGVDLTGGYYDAGDNVKYNFPMAFTITMMAWGVIEHGNSMGPELPDALEAVRWATDYFLKSTAAAPAIIYAQVGDPNADHNCWQRPEDMDTPRTVYAVTPNKPGTEVAAETAAALAAASLAFRAFGDEAYGKVLLERAVKVFEFADKYRRSYNESIGEGVCPFYCSYSGYQDELLWGAAWLYKATNKVYYWNYVKKNVISFKSNIEAANFEFSWDSKHAGISVLVSNWVLKNNKEASTTPFLSYADSFMCSLIPESPTKNVQFTPGGLLMRGGKCDLQQVTSYSFLVLAYTNYLKNSTHVIRCKDKIINHTQLLNFTKNQVDYILGSNPLNMSYMVGYGAKFPRRMHHRGSSIPSLDQRPDHIGCQEWFPNFDNTSPNPNELTGAVSGGPEIDDSFADARANSSKSEPTTYIVSPLVGLLAYFSKAAAH